MKLYLMRHAEALVTNGKIRSDEERPLSTRGRAQARSIGDQLRRRGHPLSQILSSPLLRTRETAAIISEVFGLPVETTPHLAPSGTVLRLSLILPKKSLDAGVLLVGHQPDVGMLAASLAPLSNGFSPATLAAFETATGPKGWTLLFVLTARDVPA